jgi:hypothetical protein
VATNFYPDGLGGTVDIVATNEPFYGFDARALYVHFATGVDTVGTDGGKDKQRPLKTLAKAVANATPNDVIVLLDGHDEVLTATLILDKIGLIIVGCGQTAGVPNVRLRLDLAVGTMLNVTAACVQLRNIRFGPNVQPNGFSSVSVSGAGFVMDHCYMELGENDYSGLVLGGGADHVRILDSTFISTALVAGTQPHSAITNSGNHSGLHMDGVVVSDGVLGFSNHWGIDLLAGVASNISAYRLSLLLGASARFSGSTGFIIPVVTGGGVIDTQ